MALILIDSSTPGFYTFTFYRITTINSIKNIDYIENIKHLNTFKTCFALKLSLSHKLSQEKVTERVSFPNCIFCHFGYSEDYLHCYVHSFITNCLLRFRSFPKYRNGRGTFTVTVLCTTSISLLKSSSKFAYYFKCFIVIMLSFVK